MTKIYKTWLERIESGALTYGQMLQFCQTIGVVGGHDRESSGGKRTALTPDEMVDLWERFKALPDGLDLIGETYRVRGKSWKQVGRDWIEQHGKRVGLPTEMVAVAQQLDFRLVDVYLHRADYGWGYGGPCYRAFTADQAWTYAPTAWQATAYGPKADQHQCNWEKVNG